MIGERPRRPSGDRQRTESLRETLLRDRFFDDDPPLVARARLNPYAANDPGSRSGHLALLTIVEAGAVALTLLAVSLWQATQPSIALPAQARGLSALTEVDALIALRLADLQRQLDAGVDALTLDGFPMRDLAIDRSEAESPDGTLDPTAYRTALLDAGAREVYERGAEALRGPDTTTSDYLIEGFTDTLTRARHGQAAAALGAASALVVVLALLLLRVSRGRRWLALGLALAIGGVLALVPTAALRGALALLDTPPGAALTEYVAVTRTLLRLPLWNALAALALGVALSAPGVVGRGRGR